MRKSERHRAILALLEEQPFLSVDFLVDELESAPITIRRDLNELDRMGRLSRVHGGAEGLETKHRFVGRSFERNLAHNAEAKRAIAAAAAGLCDDGDAIILDGGTTTYSMVPFLKGRHLSVLTNSLHIVEAFGGDSNTRLMLTGGEVFAKQNIVLSPHDDLGVGAFAASWLFLSCEAVAPDGLKQSDTLLVHGEKRMLKLTNRTAVLADASKFHRDAPVRLCELDAVDTIVTEGPIPADLEKALETASVQKMIV